LPPGDVFTAAALHGSALNDLILCELTRMARMSLWPPAADRDPAFSIQSLKGVCSMKAVQKRSCLMMFAFLLAYAGITLAAPVAPFPAKGDGATATQAQTDKPVDCKKHPQDPSCKKK